jgi:leucyl aminopeptidase (aminopeptidase T)
MRKKSLLDEYRHPGCRPNAKMRGVFGDPNARVIRLERHQKKQLAAYAAQRTRAITTRRSSECATWRAEMRGYIWKWMCGEYNADGAAK